MTPTMRPENENDLSDLLRGATAPLVLRGGGTRWVGTAAAGPMLETGGLAGIRLYEPGALTLVAGAGTPLAEVTAVLAGERQRLAFEPPDLRALLRRDGVSTVGGVAAANAAGPRRVQSGAARDSMIGLRFVDGRGVAIKNGGRVMKNVTGYDLVKLLAGSHGTLGVITEVAFKLQAMPEAECTLLSQDLGLEAGLAALRRALGSPYDLSGAAHADGKTLLRLEGMAGSVAYRAGQVERLLGGAWQRIDGPASAALWQDLRDVAPLTGAEGAIWRVAVIPDRAARLMAALAPLNPRALFDWGGGLIWLCIAGQPDGGATALRAAVAGIGHATLYRTDPGGRADVPHFPPQDPALAALAAGLRAKFDPKALLNRGLMG